jgi:hypothetical protein
MPDIPTPDWLHPNYRDAQGRPRRIAVAMSEQALHDHAAKHGKQIEAMHPMQRERKHRQGSVTRRKIVTVIYGLLSA